LSVIDSSAFEQVTPVAQLIKEGDVVVRAVLQEVTDQHRVIDTGVEGDNPDFAEERLGLVFELLEVYAGSAQAGEVTVVEAIGGYQVQSKTLVRTAELRTNGIGPDHWAVGAEYLFFYVVDQNLGPRFRSTALVSVLGEGDALLPLASQSVHPEFNGVKNLEQARAVLNEALSG
jgi:hypothetical protein